MSKCRSICGMNFPISMIEIFLPMQVLAPYPNYKDRVNFGLDRHVESGNNLQSINSDP